MRSQDQKPLTPALHAGPVGQEQRGGRLGRGFWAVSPRVLIYLAMRTAVSQRGDIESPWRPGSPAPCFDKRHGAGRADQRGESSFSQRLHARPQANLLQITKTRAGGLPVSPLSAGIFCHQGELQMLRQVKQTQVREPRRQLMDASGKAPGSEETVRAAESEGRRLGSHLRPPRR